MQKICKNQEIHKKNRNTIQQYQLICHSITFLLTLYLIYSILIEVCENVTYTNHNSIVMNIKGFQCHCYKMQHIERILK